MPISSLFRFIKIRLEIMLKEFADKKETFLDYKKQNFQKSKNSYFAKGVNPRFWSEKCQFFLYLFLVKTRLEIILNAFVEKKETFFDYNKLSQIWQLFGPFKFCQNKTRNNAWRLRREKRNLF